MDKVFKRNRRKIKIRKNVSGTEVTPRVTVFRSNRFVYAQAIDDTKGTTLAAASAQKSTVSQTEQAKVVAKSLAESLKKKKIETIVFDRNGYKYHGSIKMLADTLRDNKIKF